jgi:hypothetical protein
MTGNGNGNGQYGESSPSRGDDIFTEAMREALGEVLAMERRQWERERARMQAEANEIIARLRAEIAELRSNFDRMVSERLAQLRDGERGMRGPPGEPGACGEAGPPGKLPVVKIWRPDTVHYEGEAVAFDGGTWQATKDTGQAPPHSDWICLAVAGRDCASFKVRGTYREGGEYKSFDVVAHNGGSYIAKSDNPGSCPGDGWQAMTLPGKRGDKGEKGDRGERGPRGEQGAPGVGFAYGKSIAQITPPSQCSRMGQRSRCCCANSSSSFTARRADGLIEVFSRAAAFAALGGAAVRRTSAVAVSYDRRPERSTALAR